jgi:hypothetical protein
VYFSIGERLIPSITFIVEPEQNENQFTAASVYWALKRHGRFEGRTLSNIRGNEPVKTFFNLVPINPQKTDENQAEHSTE